jgi:hypothetical protein
MPASLPCAQELRPVGEIEVDLVLVLPVIGL